MKAVIFKGKNDISLMYAPEPRIEKADDVVIKVTTCSICGSDIHTKYIGNQDPGKIIGHEYCGIVVDTGAGVRGLKKGDRVAGRPAYSCGQCYYCRHRQQSLCVNGGIFGVLGTQGVQAEYARIPFAENTLVKIPDNMEDEDVIFAGDILSTGMSGLLKNDVGLGDTVSVFGAGPVGLCAVACAPLFGAGLVIAVDILDYRLDMAGRFGAVTVNASKEDPVKKIRELTNGIGVDAGIEAAGSEATITACIRSTRRGGKASILGLIDKPLLFDLRKRFYDMFTLTMGYGDQNHVEELINMIAHGRLSVRSIITHTFPLSEALNAYDVFEKREGGCIKVLLKP
ncbi:MAG: alcohol dehydrogenase catalytic domain-containing protein [Deltaproteobacteria bacterium]|nr:alcohol dehydrogenase catalytic domain-containing protein [Deltaproteobacteria bacterium]